MRHVRRGGELTAPLLLLPLIQSPTEAPSRARMLRVAPCPVEIAREGVAKWHSRLPVTQRGPWRFAFAADFGGTVFGVALWNNPSARTLPGDWLELRRLAVAPDAPHCTASRMLGEMRKWIAANVENCPKLISYQDEDVHTGTIYRAAGWAPAWRTKARVRDRSKPRVGTHRAYRSNLNGTSPDASGKTRWEIEP